MNHRPEKSEEEILTSLLIRGGLALLVLMAWFLATASGQSLSEKSASGSQIAATDGASGIAASVHSERKPKQIP